QHVAAAAANAPLLDPGLAILPGAEAASRQYPAPGEAVLGQLHRAAVHRAPVPSALDRSLADRLGLSPGGRGHVPALIRLAALRDCADHPGNLSVLRVRRPRVHVPAAQLLRPADLQYPGYRSSDGDHRDLPCAVAAGE